ncbi:MAG: L,D-transpeptidase [Synechococcaceae cyanobacterium]|nr:L,D-transpeptidase [Synechococcaceae cyanobacterium]
MIELIASIVVDLSEQRLYAYNDRQELVRTVLVSTGTAGSPTPTGKGEVLEKYESITMRGRDYVSPDVPWTMCISEDGNICLHGAPWQEAAGERFGVPRSHGCVRMPTRQARWLYERTPHGTPVTIRP